MSNRYKGGVISATPPTTTGGNDGVASGAWTLEQQMQLQAAGLWPNQPVYYIEDVFSTYLYTGNSSTQTITNGINLSGKGGMVWIKSRSAATNHALADSTMNLAAFDCLVPNATTAKAGNGDLNAFNSNGFSLGYYAGSGNVSGSTYASWTFRKQPKFFDVVTYTGTGSARTIAHNLGSAPGCMIVKCTSNAVGWNVYHRSLTSAAYQLELNTTSAEFSDSTIWNSTAPTSTEFSVGTNLGINGSGRTYVAYLFAHNAGGFGATGSENVISCGSYTTDGSGQATINLGYEPQWVMQKRVDSSTGGDWFVADNMRGMNVGGCAGLFPNTNAVEGPQGSGPARITATGFTADRFGDATYIYIAIRRGPMAVPTLGTSVYIPDAGTNGTNGGIVPIGFPVDMSMTAYRSSGAVAVVNDRVRGYGIANSAGVTPAIQTGNTDSETGYAGSNPYFYNAWNTTITRGSNGANPGGAGIITWFMRRAPGFFDVVCYTGDGVSGRTITHNLTTPPELLIVKRRASGAANWNVGAAAGPGWGNVYILNSTGGASLTGEFTPAPTSSVFSVSDSGGVNASGSTYVAYLFATCPGVSKVGSYTGTGSAQTINCGFTTGSRLVLIKRTDSTGNWLIWDSARGIIPSNDPYLQLNLQSTAEVTGTDYVDTTSVGFDITSTAPAEINANGGTFIFLAIA